MERIDRWSRNVPTILVIVVGIAGSLIAYIAVVEHKNNEAKAAFTALASNHTHIIAAGFSQALFAIQSIGALYDSSPSISWNRFSAFAEPLLESFPTISALAWAPRVRHSERHQFELAARELFPDFRITERSGGKRLVAAVDRPVYFPVYFINPMEPNQTAHGFDLYSDVLRRAAIASAGDSGKTTSTAPVHLVQESSSEYSVLLIHPVFASEHSPGERSALLGVASAVYRIGDGVERTLSLVKPAGLDIWLFDRSAESGGQLLYFHGSRELHAKARKAAIEAPVGGSQYVHPFPLGGRNFELVVAPAPGYFAIGGGYMAILALVTGLGFTALLAAYMDLAHRRARDLLVGHQALEHQVRERQHIERQLRDANQNLEALSREDPLTGIANRRYFTEYFQQEWKRAVRHGTSLSLLLGDVDNFKSYNDSYGHIAGDKCLQKIAQVLNDALDRPGDLAARFGGEEMAVVLPDTSAAGAHDLAEKIRASLAALVKEGEDSVFAREVTMSFGCGSISPAPDTSLEEFIKRVDAALYRAKSQGRNQTVSV